MTEKQLAEISNKLDVLIRLVALFSVNDKKQLEQLDILNKSGFRPKEIANILGTTPNTVRVGLSAMRKKKRKKG